MALFTKSKNFFSLFSKHETFVKSTALIDAEDSEAHIKSEEQGKNQFDDVYANSLPTFEAVERAKEKLNRKLESIAEKISVTLDQNVTLNRYHLLRCCGLVKVVSALAGRRIRTINYTSVLLLDEYPYCEFVLKVSSVLAGGIKGGLIGKCSSDIWEGYGNKELKEAFQFLGAAALYAFSVFKNKKWHEEDLDGEYYSSIYSELVIARLFKKLNENKLKPDINIFNEIAVKLPVNIEVMNALSNDVNILANRIQKMEFDKPIGKTDLILKPGDYIYISTKNTLGVTVVIKVENNKVILLDLDSYEFMDTRKFLTSYLKVVKI